MRIDRRRFLSRAGAIGAAATGAACSTPGAPGPATQMPARSLSTGMARNLTLLTFRDEGRDQLGVKTARGILNVAQAARLLGLYAPATLDDLLQQQDGPSLEAVVKAALEGNTAQAAFRDEAGIEYGPLVSRPDKIICVGLNYRRHAEELGSPIPSHPVLFNKFTPSLNRHTGTIKLPADLASNFDYEVELVIVIGATASRVSDADALTYVAGYATGNDFTARDLQYERGGQWMVGKAIDGFAPVGPYLVTADQIDPDNLKLECRVNGETRQSSTTADFIFGTRAMISYISHFFTLKPGDLIFTGTPAGVIYGMPKERQKWLAAGDTVSCSVEKLGELTFRLA